MPYPATTVTVEPPAEPVTLTEAKAHLRVDISDDDDLIAAQIMAARHYVEQWTGRKLVEQTLETRLDCFPIARPITLPCGPVRSITSVDYIDADGALQTWAPSQYQADTVSLLARIKPAYGKTYPVTRVGDLGAVRITYVAGYAPSSDSPTDYAENVPPLAKSAIKLLLTALYENRSPVVVGSISKALEFSLESLLWTLRIRHD